MFVWFFFCVPILSPGRGFIRRETPCFFVSIAMIPSARKVSTSTTQAPSSRRTFTPGSDFRLWSLCDLTVATAARKAQIASFLIHKQMKMLVHPDTKGGQFKWLSPKVTLHLEMGHQQVREELIRTLHAPFSPRR